MAHDDARRATLSTTATPAAAAAGRTRAGLRRAGRAVALAGALLYVFGISAYLLTHGGWPTPDYLIPPLLLFAIALGRGWPFLLDWGPFLLLVLSWQATAGIADRLGRPVHLTGPLRAEMWLFRGHVPTIELQERLFDPARAHWYDWAGTIQHALHFVLPVVVGLVIWLRDRRLYWRYMTSVLVLFYIGFAGYALYPAAPPWMAGLQDAIPPVHRVAVETVQRLPASAPIGLAYTHMSANEVAAMPSLHAAVPLLLALVLIRTWGWRALPALLYPLTMGFNLVYLGEHWVVDVLAGYAAALAAYALVWLVPDLLHARLPAMRMPRVTVPRAVRLAADGALPALAVASVVVIAFTLRPGRPVSGPGPVVPGLQVQAGQGNLLDPVPCDQGASTSLTAENLLVPVTGRYSVYLFDVDAGTCYTLSANVSFPPPSIERLPALVARAPVRLAPTVRSRLGVEQIALRPGQPAPALVEAGLPEDHRYLLVVQLADVPDTEAAAQAIDELAALAIVAEPPGAPPPEPSGVEPPPAPDATAPPVPTVTPAVPVTPVPAAIASPTPADDVTPAPRPSPLLPEATPGPQAGDATPTGD